MKTVVTFGEVLMRLSPPGSQRLLQSIPGPMQLSWGGAEANVAAALAQWGTAARLVTSLPTHTLTDACCCFYRSLGVDTRFILKQNYGRCGIYFCENGIGPRAGQVIYDREGSSIAQTEGDAYPWEDIFAESKALFISGITPALSSTAAEATLRAVLEAKQRGLSIFLDLNFRRTLWQWKPEATPNQLAAEVLTPVIQLSDYLIANTGAAADIFALTSPASSLAEASLDVARAIAGRFPNLNAVAMTMRESISASYNRWSALLYDAATEQSCLAPQVGGTHCHPYEVLPIVDRVGAGDAFSAGLIHRLLSGASPAEALAFATAASFLCHTIPGDICYASEAEIDAILHNGGAGYIVR